MSEMTIGCALWTLGATPDVAALWRDSWRSPPI